MERLIHKVEEEYYPITNTYGYENVRKNIYNKLGILEDIEQELGIPLEVLFKALKDGIYVRIVGLPARRLPEYIRFDFYNKKIEECNLKDYGKTWTLTREELEDA